jgi:hypothetical protein
MRRFATRLRTARGYEPGVFKRSVVDMIDLRIPAPGQLYLS